MLAQIKLQAETMAEHGTIIDKLDELVGLASLRTAAHDKFTGSQIENRRLASEPKTAYFCIAASFIAQRACHTAQAGALLLRHGFADQAFELWRTLFNLDALLQHLCDEDGDKEARANRYLSAAASEVQFLDDEARKLGADYATMVADSDLEGSYKDVCDLVAEFGKQIDKRDGWVAPGSKSDMENLAREAGIIYLYPLYQRAGKLHHGSPISTFVRSALGSVESWDALRHSTDGVPVQCLLTAYSLHRVVSTFCDATDEIPIYQDDRWFEQSESLLGEVNELLLARPDRKAHSVVPNDSGLASGMDDTKALKRLLEDEDVEHYLRMQGRTA